MTLLRAQQFHLAVCPESTHAHVVRTEVLTLRRLSVPVTHDGGRVPADRTQPLLGVLWDTDT